MTDQDEVHMLKEKRGAILEVVVSRMKQIKADLRFVALSATVPNIEDVARHELSMHCLTDLIVGLVGLDDLYMRHICPLELSLLENDIVQ